MGAALSGFLYKPITKKESTDESNDKFICGTSSMQGWRYSQEDAHNCILDYDTDTAFFAVYDGHGGSEVSEYCSLKLPQYIKENEDYKNGKIEEALTSCFLSFDKIFTTTDFVDELNKLRPPKEHDDDDDDNNDADGGDNDDNSIVEENIDSLYKEASMPIEEVIEKYASESLKTRKINDQSSTDSSNDDTSSACCSSSTVQATTSQQSSESTNDINSDGVSSSSELKNLAQDQSNIEKLDNETKNHVPDSSDMKKDNKSNTIENGNEDKQQNSEAQAKTSDDNESKNGEIFKKDKENGSDEDDSDSESDEDEETFEAPTVDSSEDECVNTAIEVDAEDSPDVQDDDNDDDDDSDDEGGLRRYKAGYNSGCTAVVALLKGNELYVANIGDSRCIVCRNGQIIEMSFDHKPTDEPELERITKAGGEVFEERVEGGLNLSRAFGDHSYKRNKHLSDREQMITALPDIKKLTIKPNEDEFIFLACDGIWNSMTTEECVDFIRTRLHDKHEKLSEICEEMFDSCLATDAYHDSKGNDNMTAVLVKFKWNIPKRPSSPTSQTESEAKRVKTDDDCNTPQIDTTV